MDGNCCLMDVSGWGRYPRIRANITDIEDSEQLAHYVSTHDRQHPFIARGLGRSYGDSALNQHIYSTLKLRYLLAFDAKTGVLTCESGASIFTINQALIPQGWFFVVTPGTQFVTIGGAIASDIHGKNHHHVGCFSQSVLSLDLLLPNGKVITCNRKHHRALFHATCGGMGLTGVILQATIKMMPIESTLISQTTYQANSVSELIELFHQHHQASYSVAWLACNHRTKPLQHALLMLGEHTNKGELQAPATNRYTIPDYCPSFLLNRFTINVFNQLFYRRHQQTELLSLDHYFYPLDRLYHWNRLYGRNGFIQYQCVIPEAASEVAITKLLTVLCESGHCSPLATLKLLGDANNNYLSFPKRGFTLTLDIQFSSNLLSILNRFDTIVKQYDGRLYLAKDACMSSAFFKATYPGLERFNEVRAGLAYSEHIASLQSQRLGIV